MFIMSQAVELKCTSWNRRGLRKAKKIKQVMNRIKDTKSKIVVLQETHISKDEEIRMWQRSVNAVSFTTQARGVVTLIHQSVPFQISTVIKDTFGRYLIIQGSILSVNLNMVYIYGPNVDEPNFFTNLFLTLASLSGEYIIAGDWNCTLNSTKDRSTGTDLTYNRSRTAIHYFIKELNLLDIWRHLKPNDVAYSCYSSSFKTYSQSTVQSKRVLL